MRLLWTGTRQARGKLTRRRPLPPVLLCLAGTKSLFHLSASMESRQIAPPQSLNSSKPDAPGSTVKSSCKHLQISRLPSVPLQQGFSLLQSLLPITQLSAALFSCLWKGSKGARSAEWCRAVRQSAVGSLLGPAFGGTAQLLQFGPRRPLTQSSSTL